VAWIDKRETSKGQVRYLVGWREPGTGKRVHESFHRMEDARRRKTEIERQLDTEQYTAKAERETPLGVFITDMLNVEKSLGKLSASSDYHYRMTYERYVAKPLGSRPISKITTTEMERFFGSLTVSKESVYQLLSKAFNKAVAKGTLVKSPLGIGRYKAIPKPRAKKSEAVILTPPEIIDLSEAVDPRYRVAVLVGGFAGLRAGEIGGLRVKDVFEESGTPKLFIRQAVKTEGGTRVVGDLKTESSRRKITIARWLYDEILRSAEDYSPAEDGRIFTTNGVRGLLSHLELTKAMRATGSAATAHDLRHSCASILIKNKANPKQVQRHLGHSSISVTMDTYVDLWPDDLDELGDIVEGLRSEITAGRPVLELAEVSEVTS
jgi:integrase